MEAISFFQGEPSIPPIDWQKLERKAKKIDAFLRCLHEGDIGTGRMKYDAENFILAPRSALTSNRFWQFIVNRGNAQATFEANQQGFSRLLSKAKKVHEAVRQFKPNNRMDCPDEAKQFLFALMDLQNVIQQVSQQGLNQLCKNYRSFDKHEHARQLENMGGDAFSLIRKTEEHLYATLLSLNPELEKDAQIKRYYNSSEEVLLHRDGNRAHLREVLWGRNRGLVIPTLLVNDCVTDQARNVPNRAALQVAAAHIGIPKMALEIRTLDEDASWIPYRVVEKRQHLICEEGVVGSCEGGKNLCNVYSRRERRIDHLMLSAGAIDTPLKVQQVVKILTTSFTKKTLGQRLIVHQLDSFSSAEKLINGAHSLIPYFEEQLSDNLWPIPVLHLNTCFDAHSKLEAEKRSFSEINRETLVKLLGDVCRATEGALKSQDLSLLSEEVNTALQWLSDAEEFERRVNQWPNIPIEPQEGPNKKPPTKSDLEDTSKVAWEEYLKSNAKLPGLLLATIQLLEQKNEPSLEEKRALILFRLLEKIWSNQIHFPKPYSPTQEIECFLMLYRMMNWTPIFTCKNGLDRSGAVRALAEAQYILEKHFYREILTKQPDESIARFEAQEKLYALLVNLDVLKEELFRLLTTTLATLQSVLVKDLSDSISMTQAEVEANRLQGCEESSGISNNLRNLVFHHISQQVSAEEATALFNVQHYLEIVFGSLLREQEKSLNDSGALGFKYRYGSSSWFYRKGINPHPMERWPLFILTDKNIPIQILECRPVGLLPDAIQNWISDPITVTPAAVSLICRLGQLR